MKVCIETTYILANLKYRKLNFKDFYCMYRVVAVQAMKVCACVVNRESGVHCSVRHWLEISIQL